MHTTLRNPLLMAVLAAGIAAAGCAGTEAETATSFGLSDPHCCRIFRAVSIPSMPGIRMSRKTMSGRLAATVRWSRGEQFGVAFSVLPARDTLLIVDLMRVNLRSRPPPALEDA